MVEYENKFVHNAVDAKRSTDQVHFNAVRVTEDEVIAVEIRQALSSNTSGHLVNIDSLAKDSMTKKKKASALCLPWECD